MVAGDQVGIGRVSPNTFLASKTKEDKKEKGLNLGIFNMLNREKKEASEFEKIKNEAFGNTSSNAGQTDTKVASSASAGSGGGYIDAGSRGYVSPEQATKMLTYPERFKMTPGELRYLRGSMPIKKVEANDNKIYSDSTQTLGAKDGSLISMANTNNQGITTAAPETKISETKRMAGEGFFAPQNYRMSQNPDATIMTREQMGQSITGDPGYSKFGNRDAEGTQAAKDTAAFNERVKTNFFTPDKVDARSIAERREANEQSMRDNAAENYQAFKDRGGRPAPTTRISGDDTYGTNVMSNPAYGFRSKMSTDAQKSYDSSATEATRRAEVEPSKGNLITSTVNAMKRGLNQGIGAEGGTPLTKEVSLETRGEAELRRYEKYLNRPTYQKEATARNEAGITIQDVKDKNEASMKADAAARNAEFQTNKRVAAFEKADARNKATGRDQANTGTGRDGTFGTGTYGQGMPSNPDFRGAGNNKKYASEAAVNKASREGAAATGIPSGSNLKAGSFGISAAGKKQAEANKAEKKKEAVKKSEAQKKKTESAPSKPSVGRGGRRGGSKSGGSKSGGSKSGGSKSGGSKGGSKSGGTGSKSGARGAKGSAGSRSKGGTSKGGAKTNRRRSRRRCDIRCKYDIMPLTNMDLTKDDLAEVAYFVKELQK